MQKLAVDTLTFFFQGIKIGLAITLPIGPIKLLFARFSITNNFWRRLVFSSGVATADCIYAFIGALGVSTITCFIEDHAMIVHSIGITAIIALGFYIMFHRVDLTPQKGVSATHPATIFIGIMLLTMANPMTILIFSGIFAGIAGEQTFCGTGHLIPIIGGILTTILVWMNLFGLFFHNFGKKITSQQFRWVNRIAGLIIIAIGIHQIVKLYV